MIIENDKSSYPPAPWRLQGEATCLLWPVETAVVRAMVPDELSVIPILPGRALGGLYLARYGEGSALVYNELIVVPAMVWYRGRIGAWVSHIYVDDPSSVAGGREIWGLPKELATFEFSEGSMREVLVRQEERVLCTLSLGESSLSSSLPVLLPGFGRRGAFLWFRGSGWADLGVLTGDVEIPAKSPFSALGSGRRVGLHARALDVSIGTPTRLAL